MSRPLLGISLMPDEEFRKACLPLFESGSVDVVEWSFDTCWDSADLPEWANELLFFYASSNRLLGHGVSFSVLSADRAAYHQAWIENAQKECNSRKYRHVSEHFGFMSAGDFHRSAPLPVPLTEATLAVGQRNLAILQNSLGVAIGLENLAFAFSERDVADQGVFLEQLLEPVDGFLLLDLHNLYCQICNFQKPAETLLDSYPLSRVKELHVSGGSWSEVPEGLNASAIRRDTHDSAIPEDVFNLLELALQKCPNVEAVIFEQLSESVSGSEQLKQYLRDFRKLREIIDLSPRSAEPSQ